MSLNKILKRKIRPYYLKLIGMKSVGDFVHRSIYHSRFLEWSSNHPCKRVYGGYESRYELYEYLVQTEALEKAINYIEFGVYKGDSLNWWMRRNRHPESRFIGFD